MQFVAESEGHRVWNCHAAGAPQLAAGGPSAIQAFQRCCEIYDVDPRAFAAVETSPKRVVFGKPDVCPECGGTGEYIGLAVVEPCRRCAGNDTTANHG